MRKTYKISLDCSIVNINLLNNANITLSIK